MYAAFSVKTPPSPTGELGLIEQIRQTFPATSKAVTLGIGDDCAILRPPSGCEVLVTTDFTLEGRHFRRDLHPPESVGHRCLARGLSDLAAMGAEPIAAFLSLALPAAMLSSPAGRIWVARFFDGLRALAELHSVPLAGGDTSESPGGSHANILADIVLIGSAPKGKALRRSGASPGDLLYVTGHLGGAHAELTSLLKVRTKPASKTTSKVLKVRTFENHPHLFPEPRLDVGEALQRRSLATACLDLSDGLSTDLAHLCRASNVCAEIEQAAIPIHPQARKLSPAAALHAILHGGEDYELLFTAPASTRIPSSLAGVPITPIGSITRKRANQPLITLIAPDDTRTPLEPGGWEHFSKPTKPTRKTTR
ncbi:thiamine-phosphate kinase [Granulicella sp. L60]|uniref:thiamine-phosphate kinase n=1 Tax=Granulicella sp. L60 TaxID=1641866 RepID=UPI00131C7746|nr:thiamine-phosphate kinase [Granulicella sp. L60]